MECVRKEVQRISNPVLRPQYPSGSVYKIKSADVMADLQMKNHFTRMKEKNLHPLLRKKPEHPVHHPKLSQEGTMGFTSGMW